MLKGSICKSCAVAVLLSATLMSNASVFAQEPKPLLKDSGIVVSKTEAGYPVVMSNTTSIKPRYVNDFRYRKRNVKTYNEWSSFKRVSDNIVTGSSGGSISCNSTITFNASISGNIFGISVNTHGSVASSKGYTLHVGSHKRVYMAYRVRYKVETGTREYYDIVSGKALSSNRYTVKVPQYGEYKLLNY